MGDRVVSQGGRDSQGRATWGQRYIWDGMQTHFPLDGKHNQLTGIELDRDSGNSVASVCGIVSDLFSRHETFRTTYQLKPENQLWQTVTGRAEFPTEIETVTSWPTWDDVWDTMQHRFARRFELTTDMPARVTLFVLDGQVAWVVLVMAHMAVDVSSVQLVDAELRRALAEGAVSQQPVMQPLDWAEWERSAIGQSQNTRAVQYWKDTLERFTAVPGDGAKVACSPRYRNATVRVPRMYRAADVVANEVGATLSSALIAALTWTLSRSTGAESVPMSIRTGNRTQRVLREAVGHYAEIVPVVLDAPATDFAEYVKKVHWKLVHSYRYGNYDPIDVEGFLRETGERVGQQHPLRIMMNYWPGEPAEAEPDGQPEPAGQLSWLDGGVDLEFVAVLLNMSPSQSLISLLLDTTFLEPGELQEWLLDSEDLLHRTAMALRSAAATTAESAGSQPRVSEVR